MNNNIDSPESQPVSAVDERGPSLEFVDKVAKEMGLVWVVEPLNAPLRYDAAAICLRSCSVYRLEKNQILRHLKLQLINRQG